MADEQLPGSIVHMEFAVKDPDQMKAFYGDLFGWKFQDFPETNTSTFQAPSGPGGSVRFLERGEPPGTLNYILVRSIDEYVRRIEKAGGKILLKKQEVPGQGWLAWFKDPSGAMAALWEPNGAARRR